MSNPDSEIHRHSGWVVPGVLLLALALLCGAFLLYYLRPASFRDRNPASAQAMTRLSVRGVGFAIPANYVESRRRGGDMDVVPLFAALPDLRGFSQAEAGLFLGNSADSPIVHLLIRADSNGLDAAARLARIYQPYFVSANGETADFGLTRYGFRADSGYGRNDLFVGTGDSGMILMLCERPAQDVPSPNCLAIDHPIAPGVNLSWRFKRAQLAHWRQIGDGANRLVGAFREKG